MANKKSQQEWNDRKRLALALTTIRQSRGLTKEDLGKKAGYEGTAMITAIEEAKKNPEYSKVKDLANALDVSIEQLRCYGKISQTESGWPKLKESERIALYLFAPMFEVLGMDDIKSIADYALLKCRDRTPAWRQTKYQKEKAGAASKTR